MRPSLPSHARQRGITLLTTLIMMLMVMLLGLSALQISKGQFRLAGNLQLQGAAFNEAEAAVGMAEQWLTASGNAGAPGFTTYASGSGLYPIGYMASNAIDPLTMNWSDANSVAGHNVNQRYVIELIAAGKTLIPTGVGIGGRTSSGCNKTNVYRIVARGERNRGSTRFVQSVFSVLSCSA